MSRPVVDASQSRSFSTCSPSTGDSSPDRDDDLRLLAARLLEGTLLRLGRAATLVDRRLVPGLSRMRGHRLYRLLGYVRLSDYLTERLGMSLRRCQAILRLERALDGLPRMARALAAGEVSVSKIEVAAAAATPETESAWLERARRLPLGDLREAVRQARPGDQPAASSIEQDEPGRFISFPAPPSVLAVWHWTLDLVRRVAGQQEPAWRCAEFLAAEFLSGVPDTASDADVSAPMAGVSAHASFLIAAHRSLDPPSAAEHSSTAGNSGAAELAPGDVSGMAAWTAATAAVREALASGGASADPEVLLAEPPSVSDAEDESDPWQLDARLRSLVRLRQSLAWRQGRLLATLASLRLHRDLGFDAFDDWVGDRLAMSTRRARYLVSLDRRLLDLPLLADAYRRALVTWCQARLLVRVVQSGTQSRWIRYARQGTVRRLEDVIVACEAGTALAGTTAPAHIGAPLPPVEPQPGATASLPFELSGRQTSVSFGPPPAPSRPDSRDAPAAADLPRLHTSARSRISFWCPLDVASLWESALRACRAAEGQHLADWGCFLLLVRVMRDTWENHEDPHWRRRYRIFERDGWRCRAPGCTSRSALNEHHITFRSQQGADDETNLVTLCVGHHQQGVHEGRIHCFGRAPDDLWWDLGVRPGSEPLARYFGDRLVSRSRASSGGIGQRPAACRGGDAGLYAAGHIQRKVSPVTSA